MTTGPAGRGGARWLPVGLFVFGMLCLALPQSDFFRAVPGDLGDARFNALILEHVFGWLRGNGHSLWSPGFFFPFPGVLTFSDNHFGTVGVYTLLRMAGLGPELAYIGWFTLAPVANYLCGYYALRRFGLTAAGSAVGAFVFAFAMPVLVQAGHAQLGYRFAVPLASLALHRLMRDGRVVHLAWLGVWITVQFYCSIYLGYFLLLWLGGYLAAIWIGAGKASPYLRPQRVVADWWRRRDGELWRCFGILVLCGGALLALLLPYAHFSHLYGFARSPAEIHSMLPRLGSYLLADMSRWWGPLSQLVTDIPARQEQQLFVGLAVCLLAGIGVATDAARRIHVVALALIGALTLSIGGLSLYALIEWLPLANAIRAVSRIGLVMLFPLGLLAGAGMDWLVASARQQPARAVGAGLLVLLLASESASLQSSRVPLEVWRDRAAALRAQVPDGLAPDAIVFVPRQPGVPFHLSELDGMQLAQSLGRNTLNGYSGNVPPGFGQTPDPCEDLIDRLTGYAGFAQLDAAQLATLASRVVAVGAALDCAVSPTLPLRAHFIGIGGGATLTVETDAVP